MLKRYVNESLTVPGDQKGTGVAEFCLLGGGSDVSGIPEALGVRFGTQL